MSKPTLRLYVALLLVLSFGLASCRRAQTPTPSPTSRPVITFTSSAELTDTQAPTRAASSPASTVLTLTQPVDTPTEIPPSVTLLAGPTPYPGQPIPTSTASSGTPYPAAVSTPLPTSTTSSGIPYPAAGTSSPMPITSPTTGNLLQTPYPGAVTPTPFVTAALPTPGLATASPLPTVSGSIVPSFTPPPSVTPGIVRTRIRATDPRSFEIVSGQPQLVEFFAYWSKTSQSMAPVIHALEDRYDERIRFVYLDIDDPQNNLFKSLIDDRLPPLFYLLDGQGNVLGEWQGIVPAAEFESAFANVQP